MGDIMELTKREKIGLILFSSIIIIILSITYFTRRSTDDVEVTNGKNVNISNCNEASAKIKEKEKQEIKVYICGEVSKPGVYSLLEGDRLDKLVTIAGGITQRADTTMINLAMKLKDEQFIVVPAKGTKIANGQGMSGNMSQGNSLGKVAGDSGGLININTASKEELKSLPRIGDALSQRILDYREKNGSFKNIEEIKEVSGIGDKMFENIKDKITT